MQVGAINGVNSINFQGSKKKISSAEAKKILEAAKEVNDTKEKASQDVHPGTIIAAVTAALAACFAMKGKAMPLIRKGVATIAEAVAKGATNIAKVVNKNIDTEKTGKSIESFMDKFRSSEVDEKMLETTKKWATKIFGDEEKAANLVKKMEDLKITNAGQLFDFVAGLFVAWQVADGTSDVVEDGIDKSKINQSVNNLKELVGALGFDLGDEQIIKLITSKLANHGSENDSTEIEVSDEIETDDFQDDIAIEEYLD